MEPKSASPSLCAEPDSWKSCGGLKDVNFKKAHTSLFQVQSPGVQVQGRYTICQRAASRCVRMSSHAFQGPWASCCTSRLYPVLEFQESNMKKVQALPVLILGFSFLSKVTAALPDPPSGLPAGNMVERDGSQDLRRGIPRRVQSQPGAQSQEGKSWFA